MHIKNILYILTTLMWSYSTSHAHYYVIDINDTICLLNDVDPDKTPKVVNGQLVAQNIFLQSDPSISLEKYIKTIYKDDKKMQRQTYGDFVEKADDLFRNGLISQESLEQIPILSKKYAEARDKINNLEDNHLFNSIYKFINYILIHDSQAAFVIQSFGKEIPMVLKALNKRFHDRLRVEMEVANFDEQGHLNFNGQVYDKPKAMRNLLQPMTVRGWRNNYAAGGKKILFFRDDPEEFIKTFFFDDNAHQFAEVVYNGKVLSQKEGLRFAKPYIFNVDTAQALTDENYFIDLLKKQISALSYNIELSGLSTKPHLWSQRAPAIYAKLRQHELLMLQEVSHKQFIDIQQALPRYTFIGVNSITGASLAEEADDQTEGMVIGFDSSIFEMANQTSVNRWFSDTPAWAGSKGWGLWQMQFAKLLQRLLLIHKPTQSKIAVYNSHFSHENHPENVINPRLEASKIEIEMIKKDLQNDLLVISGGDRNTHRPENEDVLRVYTNFKDLREAIMEGLNTTFLGYENHPRMNPLNNGKFTNSEVLDWVYYSKYFTQVQAVVRSGSYDEKGFLNDYHDREVQNDLRDFASDHASLSVHLIIKPKTQKSQ